MEIKKSNSLDYKINFNDIFLRELGFDITEDDNMYVYDMDTNSILQITGKFIKYTEELFPKLRDNELDLNLIENFRLAETLFSIYLEKYSKRNNIKVLGFSQTKIKGSPKGKFIVTYTNIGDDEIKTLESGAYINQSVRIFSLLCILSHRKHLYDLDNFDIVIIKDKVRI